MFLLALDTTGPAASAAVLHEAGLYQSYLEDQHTHSEKIAFLIQEALEKAGGHPKDITHLAVSAGPGSFTGIRIGVSMAKAMAQALSVPLLGVSTLRVLLHQADQTPLSCAVMDARRGQVYCAATANGQVVVEESAMLLPSFLKAIAGTGQTPCFAGDAVRTMGEKIEELWEGPLVWAPKEALLQQAKTVAVLAKQAPPQAWTTPFALLPQYLRLPQAERERLAREQQ